MVLNNRTKGATYMNVIAIGAELGESVSVATPGKDGSIDTSMSGGVSAVTGVKPPMELFTITEAGIFAQATISGV